MDITFIQSADAEKYAQMLAVTSRTVIEYCQRHGFIYESYLGIKRGFHPWQATYNRIYQLKELIDRGRGGWVVHLDADAYIVDLDFDLHRYLAEKSQYSAVLTPSMATDEIWDVNVGVALFNLDHPVGRQIALEWHHLTMLKLSDQRLRDAVAWLDDDSDQDILQQMLKQKPELTSTVYMQSTDLMNSSFATFIRQFLRGYSSTFEERMKAITLEVAAVRTGHGPSGNVLDNAEDAFEALGRAKEEVVNGLYQAILRRDPDSVGKADAVEHVGLFGFEVGTRNLASSMIASGEFRNLPPLD